MTDQKQAKETLIEKIAYEQFGRERLDDLLAKLFLLEQFLETYNSDLRTKLEEVTKERDGLRVALELILPLAKGYKPDGQTEQAVRTCASWIQNAETILTNTKGAV